MQSLAGASGGAFFISCHPPFGRAVKFSTRCLPKGGWQTYTFTFEASNVPSGIYLIRIIGEDFSTTQRVTLLK